MKPPRKRGLKEKVQAEKIKAEGRVAVELEGKLINSQTGKPEPLVVIMTVCRVSGQIRMSRPLPKVSTHVGIW